MIDINQSYERPLLSRLALRYTPRNYIASQIFPWILVPKDRVSYFKFDRGATFKRANTLYAARAKANELELHGTKQTHDLGHKGLAAWIDDDERRQTEGIGDIRAIKMQMLKDGHFLDLEKRISTALFNAANYPTANKATLSGTGQWSDPTSDPKKAVITAASGLIKQPNTMVVGKLVDNALQTHPKVLDAVKYTMGGVNVTHETLARYFQVERYMVGEAHEDTAQEGQPETLGYIWGDFAWIGYVNYTNATGPAMISQPSFGWLPISRGETGNPWRVYVKSPDPTMGVGDGMEYMKVDATYEPLFPAYDLGFLWSDVLA